MNGLDLFSGIGGLTKALEGYVEPIAYCENDRYAQSVLLSRMWEGSLPEAPIWDDVRTLEARSLPLPVDIVYGGFPCQDLSVAGRGEGLAGQRSGLFFQIVRLLGDLRPAFVFLENVPAIRTRGADVVIAELARLGYDCRWDVLSASDVGANHRRERWWLLAYAKSGGQPMRGRSPGETGQPARACQGMGDGWSTVAHAPQPEVRARHGKVQTGKTNVPVRSGNSRPYVADTAKERLQNAWQRSDVKQRPQSAIHGGAVWWSTEPHVGRVAHGIPHRVDRLRGLGNSVVPSQAREAYERLAGFKI